MNPQRAPRPRPAGLGDSPPFRRGRWSLAAAAAAAVTATLALAGCASGSGNGASPGSTAAKPVSGGSLTYSVDQTEDTLNPAVSGLDVTGLIDRNIFDSLVVQAGPNSFGPWLASRWTISPDGKTYTFFLKQGVTFQDGTPFNAAAVKASLDYAVNPATKSEEAAALIAPYAGSTVVSDYQVQVKLKQPFSPLLQALSTPYLGIQSPAELAKPASGYLPVGTGPFRYVAWNKNENVILQATPAYKSPPSNAAHAGPANLSKLTFAFIGEDETRYGALTSGQVQAIARVPPVDVKPLQGSPGFYLQTAQAPGNNYNLYLNVTSAPLTSVDVRKALAESINVPALVNSVYFGQNKAATNTLSPATAFFDPAARALGYNLADAERLLAAAGYAKTDSAGYRVNRAGQELTLVWPYAAILNREQRNVLSDGIVAEAKQAGIKIERPAIDTPTLISDLENGKYSLFDSSQGRASADILRYAYTVPWAQGGGDLSLVSNPQLTSWLTEAAQTTNATVQQQDYFRAQQYVLGNAVVLPLYVENYRLGASGKVHGITFTPGASPLFYDAWLSR